MLRPSNKEKRIGQTSKPADGTAAAEAGRRALFIPIGVYYITHTHDRLLIFPGDTVSPQNDPDHNSAGDAAADSAADSASNPATNPANYPGNAAAAGAERREFYRVEDRVILRYRTVPRDAVLNAPAERHFNNSEIFELLRELRHIDHEHNNVLRALAEQNRDLGLYLKSVNRKVELVANALASLDQQQNGQEPILASISESGLAFVAEPKLEVGSIVALEIVLLPQHTAMALYAEVVMNRDQPPARSVVTFLRLREGDRQILARHILQVQIAAKRQNQNL